VFSFTYSSVALQELRCEFPWRPIEPHMGERKKQKEQLYFLPDPKI